MDGNFKVKNKFINARFHQISTDEVYGSIKKGEFYEHDQYKPNSPYSASKSSADMLVRCFNKTYGLNITTSVSSNNYGPNQHPEKFIPKLISCIKSKKQFPYMEMDQTLEIGFLLRIIVKLLLKFIILDVAEISIMWVQRRNFRIMKL